MRRVHEFNQRLPLLKSRDLRIKNFGALADVAALETSSGISYHIPDHYVADLSSKW